MPKTEEQQNVFYKLLLPDFPEEARMGMASFSMGGFGYLVAGATEQAVMLKEVWRFDPATFEWTQLVDAPLSTVLGLGTVVDDRAYVVFDNQFYSYSPPSTWTALGDLPFTEFPTFMAGVGGKVFLGEQSLHGGRAVVWEFDPTTATWTGSASPGASCR